MNKSDVESIYKDLVDSLCDMPDLDVNGPVEPEDYAEEMLLS